MTPNDLEVLIHCHVSPTPHPRKGVLSVRDALKWLRQEGCIAQELTAPDVDTYYVTTDKGKAWIKEILNVPMPQKVSHWCNEKGEIIS